MLIQSQCSRQYGKNDLQNISVPIGKDLHVFAMSQFVGDGSNFSVTEYSTPGMAAKYSDECMFVCQSVRMHIPQTTRVNFTKFSVHAACGHNSELL